MEGGRDGVGLLHQAGRPDEGEETAAVAETGGLHCDINGSAEMGIGNAANLHLAASSAIMDLPGSIP